MFVVVKDSGPIRHPRLFFLVIKVVVVTVVSVVVVTLASMYAKVIDYHERK